jgi:hypothetical protein
LIGDTLRLYSGACGTAMGLAELSAHRLGWSPFEPITIVTARDRYETETTWRRRLACESLTVKLAPPGKHSRLGAGSFP